MTEHWTPNAVRPVLLEVRSLELDCRRLSLAALEIAGLDVL